MQLKNIACCKVIYPHDISIRFLEHSDILQFFEELGVKLDLFYRQLWRHILTVELLRIRFEIINPEQSQGLFGRLTEWVARDYVKK